MSEWQTYLPDEDRKIYDKAGYSEKQPFGKKPALLIIDVVLSWTGTKPMDIFEAIDEYKSSCGRAAWESLPKIKELLDTAREVGINVTFIKGNPVNKYFVGSSSKRALTKDEIFQTFGAPIHPMVQPLDTEYVCEKTRASAFFGTPLATYLHKEGIDCLLVSGCTTSGCVRSSALDAWNHGFPVFVVEECVFDRSRHSHLTALYELNAKFATVITLEEAKQLLRQF
jgi:nicotinamidase-related amidase